MLILFQILILGAALVAFIGWIRLIIHAFKNDDTLWGTLMVVGLFLPLVGPILTIVYLVKRWHSVRPAALMYIWGSVAAVVLSVATVVFAFQTLGSVRMEGGGSSPPGSQTENGAVPQTSTEAVPPRRRAPETTTPTGESPSTPKPAPRPNVESQPVEARSKAPPSPPAPERDPRVSPIRVKLVELGHPGANQLRTLRLRIANDENPPVSEVKLDLAYLDASGLRIGGWKTVYSDTKPLAEAKATNEFEMIAFFVPTFTADVHLSVEAVKFTDGTRWPE